MKRRQFLQTALTSAATPLAFGSSDASPAMFEIIDTHQHLWDPARINPPWLQSAPARIAGRHHLAEYRTATEGFHVTAIYMEIDVAESDLDREADEVIALCQDATSGVVAATLGGRPDAPDFADYLKRHAASGKVRGIRQVLHGGSTPPGHCLRPEFVRGIRSLGEQGLHFDLCMRPKELRDGVALAQRCPETRFVIDHCGNADVKAFLPGAGQADHDADDWRRSMEELAGLPNTICKISGVIARLPKDMSPLALAPIVNHCLDTFGPTRVIFGGDWPVCLLGGTWKQWTETLAVIVHPRPETERMALWSENARKFYRLSP